MQNNESPLYSRPFKWEYNEENNTPGIKEYHCFFKGKLIGGVAIHGGIFKTVSGWLYDQNGDKKEEFKFDNDWTDGACMRVEQQYKDSIKDLDNEQK